MDRRRLGRTGHEVTEIGIGTWQLGGDFGAIDEARAGAILDAAIDRGIDFWDTADVYGAGRSEALIGAARPQRHGAVVATKLGRSAALYPDKYTLDGLRESLRGSAERLGVETIDLAQLHCVPEPVLRDGAIFGWMDALRDEGLVAHWGASVETVEEGLLCLEQPGCATLQIIFNLFRQDAAERLLPEAARRDVGIIVRLPLASGLLSGKFGRGHRFAAEDHRNFNRDGQAFNVGETFSGLPFEKGVELSEKLAGMAPEGWPLTHLALRWILDHPEVSTVIAGVSRPEQLDDNIAAAARPPLPAELRAELATFYRDEVRPHVRGGI